MTGLPPAEPLAWTGISLIGLFAVWQLHVRPRLKGLRGRASAG